MNPTDYLRLGTEQYLRELPDDEFDELIERVRPPKPSPHETEQVAFIKSFVGGRDH